MPNQKATFELRLQKALAEKDKAFSKYEIREGSTIIAYPGGGKEPVLVRLAAWILRGYGCRMQTQFHDLSKK